MLNDFDPDDFILNFPEFMKITRANIKKISYLVVEDISINNFNAIRGVFDYAPHLKIIMYYEKDTISLKSIFQLPVSLPFLKTPNHKRFIEYLKLVRSNLKHSQQRKNYYQKGYSLDTSQKLLSFGLKQVRLSTTEFNLLHSLMHNNGRIVEKSKLLEEVWNYNVFTNTKTLEVHISRLRKILFNNFNIRPIKTIYKAGYMFNI